MYAVAYTPQSTILSSCIVPENFTLTALNGSDIEVGDVFYYPEQNQILICAEDTQTYRKIVTVNGSNLTDINGSTANFSIDDTLTRLYDVNYGEIGVSRISYYCGDTPVSGIVGRNGIKVCVRVCNTTANDANNIPVSLYDGETLVAESEVSVNSEGYAEVTIDCGSHSFVRGNATVVIG